LKQIPQTLILGTAGTPEGCERIVKLGVHHAFNHKDEDYIDKITQVTKDNGGVDIVLEMLANVNLNKDLQILAKRGRVVVIGSRGQIEINPRDLMSKSSSVVGCMMYNVTEEERKEIIDNIQKGIFENYLSPTIGKKYSLENAFQSHIDILDSSIGHDGKLVILPWGVESTF